MQAKVTLTKKDVTVVLDYPLTFQAGDKKEQVSEFLAQKDVGMLEILRIITKVIKYQKDNNFLIPDNPLQENSLEFKFTAYENDLIISVKDPNYIINNKPYEFVFVERI